MAQPERKTSSPSASSARGSARGRSSPKLGDQLALPLSDQERRASRKQLDQLHPGNRLRLMFGQPLLPQEGDAAEK
ncbi:MAG: hypothetical protein LDL31_06860 [Prosthecobacter sp.]|nr:hypothetical protein [Prosthecobacter sp.]